MSGKYIDQFITDQPLGFEFDPDTGLVSLVIHASFSGLAGPAHQVDGRTLYMPVRVMMTPESAQQLLADLPKVEAILVKSKQGITKPNFLQ
jgi:hypothetical protein